MCLHSGGDELFLTESVGTEFPLARLLAPLQVVLSPGDILFVPANTPHLVENIGKEEPTVAISGNFLDTSNLAYVSTFESISCWRWRATERIGRRCFLCSHRISYAAGVQQRAWSRLDSQTTTTGALPSVCRRLALTDTLTRLRTLTCPGSSSRAWKAKPEGGCC